MRRLVLLLAFCWLAPLASGQDNHFTPQHVAKLRSVTEAVIAPDGAQVAYVLAVPREIPREKDGGAWTELHVVDRNGASTPFITGAVNVGSIQWTPDGKSIAYLAKRDKDEFRTLYLIPMRGGESRKIVTHGSDIQGYSFSGDGKQVAFLATEPIAKAKKTQQDQGFSQEIYEEDQPNVRVWISKIPDSGTESSTKKLKLEGSASELHWNPKEDKLAVALAPNALIDEHLMFRKVHIVDLKTGKAKNVNNPGKMGQLAWSPDGKHLALITGVDKHDPSQGRLWVHKLGNDFPQWRKISSDEGKYHVDSVAWLDADLIQGFESRGVDTYWWTTRAEPKPAEAPKILSFPLNQIAGNITVAGNPRGTACIVHTPAHPPEVYFLGGNDATFRRVTDSNPWLRSMRFAKQEVIKNKARDGLELEGILVHPLNEKPGQRYPLVVNVHGGPEAHYSNGWVTLYHSLGQVGAAKGMAVFYPNYRGSTGYGVKFSEMGQRDAGGKEFDDLVDGVDHLIKMGLVDAKKVGITGGSYGGYATAWGATYYSDRFAAGVMFVGVSDWISCSGTTDIPHEMHLVHHRKWLWEDWDYFLKRSPIYHLDKAKTPLLILHGKSDPRVHTSQSLELYRHLKVRKQAPVRLVLYPGEGHGNRRAASRLDYNLRLLQWMEHYLQGPGGAPPPLELNYGLSAPAKSASAGSTSWQRPRAASATSWLGGGCPCCIGW